MGGPWLDYDPRTKDIDGDVVMRVGGGKRHRRYWIVDGAIELLSSLAVSGVSKEHEIEPSHTTSIRQLTSLDKTTLG
jgi:hypothetical protein